MPIVNEAECLAAGVDPKVVEALGRRIERAAKEAAVLGITVFGGSGAGTLRFDGHPNRPLILANLDGGHFDGGDGACWPDEDGLMRGE